MKTKISNGIFYSLNVSDIQYVAQQELQRNLSDKEIEIVKDLAVSQINSYDVIANAILEGTSKR
jgi:hypothetical protein